MTLEPEEARSLINSLTKNMSIRACDLANHVWDTDQSSDSPQKEHYGEAWSFLYGISQALSLIRREGLWVEQDDATEEHYRARRSYTMQKWEENYETYGYGPHGRGLEIGKRLALHEDRDFTFVEESVQECDDSQIDFDFTHGQ